MAILFPARIGPGKTFFIPATNQKYVLQCVLEKDVEYSESGRHPVWTSKDLNAWWEKKMSKEMCGEYEWEERAQVQEALYTTGMNTYPPRIREDLWSSYASNQAGIPGAF